jgi:hypothetical protein
MKRACISRVASVLPPRLLPLEPLGEIDSSLIPHVDDLPALWRALAQVLSVEGLEQGDVVVFLGLLPPPFLFLVTQDEVIAREVSQVHCVEVADACS